MCKPTDCPGRASLPSAWTPTAPTGGTLLTEVVLDLHKQGQLIHFDHVEGQAFLPKTPGPPDAVEVGLIVWLLQLVHGEVKVHNDRDLLHVNP